MSPEKIIELLETVLEEVRVLRKSMSSDGLRLLAAKQVFAVPDTPARIITALAARPLLTREALSIILYAHKDDLRSRNTIDVFMGRVRRALAKEGIQLITIKRQGWCVRDDQRQKLNDLLEAG